MTKQRLENLPVIISKSDRTTRSNKTGTWRFMRPLYDDKTAPCSAACPAAEDIAQIEMLVSRRRFKSAWELLLAENPFPAVCGRVCFHTCEGACNRTHFDQPLGIRHLERFLGDRAVEQGWAPAEKPFDRRMEKIAVIGAGPAGLTAAFYLSRMGYACEIFEASAAPGGLLRWGIPAYRLPGDVLEREIARITEHQNVSLNCLARLDTEFIDRAGNQYHGVFVACGNTLPIVTHIPGEELMADGLAFLNRIRQAVPLDFGGEAAVIGGGNTAVDVARTLLRLGARPTICYRRRRSDMPAYQHELSAALEEGIALMELVAPARLIKAGEKLELTLQPMKAGARENSGRRRVLPDGDRLKKLAVDKVFRAIGAEADPKWFPGRSPGPTRLDLGHSCLTADPLPVIYGGDLTNEIRSVAHAIASGKQAAMALDVFLKQGAHAVKGRLAGCRVGDGPAVSMEAYFGATRGSRNREVVPFETINTDYFSRKPRTPVPQPAKKAREDTFAETTGTLSTPDAVGEASRCFNCGMCIQCDNCRIFCPEVAVSYDKTREIDLDYCKGCGICVTECPRNAMALKEEEA